MRRCKCGFLVDVDIDGEICPSCGGPVAGKIIEEDIKESCCCQECVDICDCKDELEDDCYEEDLITDEDEDDEDDLEDDDEDWFPKVDDDEED